MSVASGDHPGSDHLLSSVRPKLEWTLERRVAYVRSDKWIEYSAATTALNALTDLLAQPDEKLRQRAVLVAARADNGKSALLKRFVKRNRLVATDLGEAAVPVVRVWTPDEPNEGKLWSQILKALKTPHRASDPAKHLKGQVLSQLEFLRVRLLMFYELHNILLGSARKTEHLLTLLKMLVNELPVRIAAAGTEDAVRALAFDKQLATRFDCFTLPPWRETRPVRILLRGMEATMPLPEPSGLHSPELMRVMEETANQTIGGYVTQVQRAAILAMTSGKPRIDEAVIRAARKHAGTDLDSAADDL